MLACVLNPETGQESKNVWIASGSPGDRSVVFNFPASETSIQKNLVELASNLRTNTIIAFTNTKQLPLLTIFISHNLFLLHFQRFFKESIIYYGISNG